MDFSTDKIYLRSALMSDSELILEWRNSAFVKQMFIRQENITLDDHMHWIETKIQKGKAFQFIICLKNSVEIGSVYIQNVDFALKQAEYGIFIGEPEYCGNGYGSDAARLMIKFAFEELNLEKLYLQVLAKNTRAIRSYMKVGYSITSYKQVEIGGKSEDVVIMSIERKDIS